MRAHEEANRAAWDVHAARYEEPGRRHWAADEITWGIFDLPEATVRALPEDLAGKDVVELGCGTAYVSAWLARRGANCTGVDLSPNQLKTARTLQEEHDLHFPLIEASAEDVPLPDACADLAISEYGAALWCDPERWIAEAARLLRPGGRLVFLTMHPFVVMCTAPDAPRADERLHRPWFGLGATSWADEPGVEFHVPHGEKSRILFENGFLTERLIELRCPSDDFTSDRYDFVTTEWARRWPAEEIWVAVKR